MRCNGTFRTNPKVVGTTLLLASLRNIKRPSFSTPTHLTTISLSRRSPNTPIYAFCALPINNITAKMDMHEFILLYPQPALPAAPKHPAPSQRSCLLALKREKKRERRRTIYVHGGTRDLPEEKRQEVRDTKYWKTDPPKKKPEKKKKPAEPAKPAPAPAAAPKKLFLRMLF